MTPDADRALAEVGRLLQMRPDDPFYQELQGQILYESRRFDAAIAAYGRAVDLAPREALILAGYGRALLAPDTAGNNARALEVLTRAQARDPFDPRMLRDLGLAYARAGQPGMAAGHRRTLRDPAPDGRCRSPGQPGHRASAARVPRLDSRPRCVTRGASRPTTEMSA
jgi:predicted Zn-dependent protease